MLRMKNCPNQHTVDFHTVFSVPKIPTCEQQPLIFLNSLLLRNCSSHIVPALLLLDTVVINQTPTHCNNEGPLTEWFYNPSSRKESYYGQRNLLEATRYLPMMPLGFRFSHTHDFHKNRHNTFLTVLVYQFNIWFQFPYHRR